MDFAEALRQRLIAQSELFAALNSHTTITGTGRERALADRAHSSFLQAGKTQVLDDLPI